MTIIISTNRPDSSVGRVSGKREVMGSIPGRDKPKLLKMTPAALRLEVELGMVNLVSG